MEIDNNKETFSADEFVNNLLKDGANIPCDETLDYYNNNEIPTFYNAALYKRGQKFFKAHIFALLYGKLLGLLSVLAIPSIRDILVHTKMSGSEMTAYRRYMSTIFHMLVWYRNDFTPGSTLWKSITDVRSKHNSASKRACKSGLHRISQKDMALTQFGFMGFAVTKQHSIGLHSIKNDDWQGFIHVWQVIGAAMGIQDRFNICRDSVDETKQICDKLVSHAFRPHIDQKDAKFIEMATYLIEGLWCFNPTLGVKTYLTLLYDQVQDGNLNNNSGKRKITSYDYVQLGIGQKIHLVIHNFVTWSLRFRVARWYHNSVQVLSLWIMGVFPFLAYYRYGRANAHVKI